MNKEVRVRFAPSPTGALHIGGVRTALYNYLFAKKHNGKFLLRIEDTDQSRFVSKAEDYINQSLQWCGIEPDESPLQGGDYGPYTQSERKALYGQYASQLLDEGKAYLAFDTPEELESMREHLKTAKATSLNYNSISRNSMTNSLTLSAEEVQKRISDGEPYVVRIKIPSKEEVRFKDEIRGWVNVHTSSMDDKVLMKSDGMPTYHLANVVDDYLMKISHVIRGEEWLPSAPLHVLLYQYLGWEDSMPTFAHLPLILKPDGNGKLSKRDSEKHGFPIFPLSWVGDNGELTGFKERGFLAPAFVNFLVFMGWNPGVEDEIFNLDELISSFTLDRVSKAGAKFDYQKAIWFNQQYIRKMKLEQLAAILIGQTKASNIECNQDKATEVAKLLQERVDFTVDLLSSGMYFFQKPSEYNESIIKKKWKPITKAVFLDLSIVLESLEKVSAEEFQTILSEAISKNETKNGVVMQILRVAITGLAGGPDLMKIVEILGANEISERIKTAITFFDSLEFNQ